MRIVCISDTHLRQPEVPDGDVLIHAGDATFTGNAFEIMKFSAWFSSLPHPHKIFVPGNHDIGFETHRQLAKGLLHPDIILLIDSAVRIDGIKFYGTPWQPAFMNWAFNLPRGPELRKKWAKIPKNTDVLITHGPPFGVGDWVERGEQVGDTDLLSWVEKHQPKLHVFGHIHGGYGQYKIRDTIAVNASICNELYQAVNPPIVVDLGETDEP